MSRRIFHDIEEAIFREVRRISFDDKRTVSLTVLQDVYDVFTGELVKTPVEASFYDSSADTNHIQYPHFFVKLLYSREDRFTGRVLPQYGKQIITPLLTSPQAFDIVFNLEDGLIATPGNTITTSNFQIRKIQPGYWLRLLTGNNIGTYIVTSITPSNSGAHTITVSNTLIADLPAFNFDVPNSTVYFNTPLDLHTIQTNDVFTDSVGNVFDILEIRHYNSTIKLSPAVTPNLSAGSTITRTGNIFKNIDSTSTVGIILNPNDPIVRTRYTPLVDMNNQQLAVGSTGISPPIPIDAYYLVRIDSKERDQHINILNRVWEEFNPPRTGLSTIIRSPLSAEQNFVTNIPEGGSSTVFVTDNSKFNINDSVFVIDNFHPTQKAREGFDTPFQSIITQKIGNNQLVLADVVPDFFTIENTAKIISNASFYLLMFHFVDHKTKDVEGAQYWSHEFTFWVQFWIDRQGDPTHFNGVIQNIETPNTLI